MSDVPDEKRMIPAMPPGSAVLEVGILPGTDWLRSATLFVLCLGYVCAFANYCNGDGVKMTIVALIVSALIAYAGQVQAFLLAREPLNEVVSLTVLFRPKLLATIGSIAFLSTLCVWFVLTGGVLRSPFSPIFTISPLYFLLQLSSVGDKQRFEQLAGDWAAAKSVSETNVAQLWRWVRVLQAIGLAISLVTITAGERGVHLRRDEIATFLDVIASCKFTGIMYVSFYVTVLLASPSAFPSDLRAWAVARIVGTHRLDRYLK